VPEERRFRASAAYGLVGEFLEQTCLSRFGKRGEAVEYGLADTENGVRTEFPRCGSSLFFDAD
jgi:hypothetical protein